MSSVDQFPTSTTRIEDTPTPFREALLQRIDENECVRHLIFSPEFGAAKFRALASLLCVTDRRWLMVLRESDESMIVDASSFDSTLLVELTIILLYGQLKIDFVLNGEARTTALQFNAVMQHVYSEAVQAILEAIDRKEDASSGLDCSRSPIFMGWPLKFRNFSIIYMPAKSQLLDGVYWNEIRGGFRRELAPAVAILLTDRHIIVIAEEKSTRWFHFRHHAKYGAIITYFPLNRLGDFRIDRQRRFSILELQGHEGQGGEKLKIMFPADKREAVSRLMEKAASPAPCAVVDHLTSLK